MKLAKLNDKYPVFRILFVLEVLKINQEHFLNRDNIIGNKKHLGLVKMSAMIIMPASGYSLNIVLFIFCVISVGDRSAV